MIDPLQPDWASCQVVYGKAKGGKGTKMENYMVGQTIENLNALLVDNCDEEKAKAGKSSESEKQASAEAVEIN